MDNFENRMWKWQLLFNASVIVFMLASLFRGK